jgi:TrmH family RNA methyltransferase
MTGAVTRQHSSVKRYRALAASPAGSGLDRELLLDGLHLLAEAAASGLKIDTAAFEHAVLDQPEARKLAERLSAGGTEVLIVSRNVLDAMSPVKTPSGAVGIAHRSLVPLRDALGASPSLVLLAHDVQDPGNVGALLRTAEAAGATAFVACGGTADPLGWKALRGSMGSALRVRIARADVHEALRGCADAGIPVTALVPRAGDSLFSADLRGPMALLLGSEGAGLPPELTRQAAHRLSIPMQPPIESLNVAVAAALVLYEAFRQRTPVADARRAHLQ